jgi:hypothetical protein
MRYLVAMIVAVVTALIATMFVSSSIANRAVDMFTFDNPDQVADLHTLVFMGVNLLALLLGWLVGWMIGAGFAGDDKAERPN